MHVYCIFTIDRYGNRILRSGCQIDNRHAAIHPAYRSMRKLQWTGGVRDLMVASFFLQTPGLNMKLSARVKHIAVEAIAAGAPGDLSESR